MKSLCKIIKSIESIESRLDKLENISKNVTEIEKKQSRVEERLNELEVSHEFLGSKCNNQQVQLIKYQKKIKTWLKKICF